MLVDRISHHHRLVCASCSESNPCDAKGRECRLSLDVNNPLTFYGRRTTSRWWRLKLDSLMNIPWAQCRLINPGLVPSCSYVTATDQASVCCIGMDSDMQLLPNFFGPCGQRHGSRFAWSAPSWFWPLWETFFSDDEEKGKRLMLLSSSSIDTQVTCAQLCQCHEHGVGLWDGSLLHYCVPLYFPMRKPMTWQPSNGFKNSRSITGWHDWHFALWLQFTHTGNTWLNVTDTNAMTCRWRNWRN